VSASATGTCAESAVRSATSGTVATRHPTPHRACGHFHRENRCATLVLRSPPGHRPAGWYLGQGCELSGRPVPVWPYHPLFTDSDLPTAEADFTRRRAIVEIMFAELIDGPFAHVPSGRFAADCARMLCAAIAHNFLRGADTLAGAGHAAARGATLRRDLENVPTRPARRPFLHLPASPTPTNRPTGPDKN
jgi:hypothetical protein